MTSRFTGQRAAGAAAGLAIVLLIALIGLLWTGVRMGFFSTHSDEQPKSHNDHSSNEKYNPEHGEVVELVKPLKTSPGGPLEQNLLYGDDIWAQPELPQENPPLRHHSGHFRHKMAAIWDPHPQYEFTAFGKTFHLMLQHDSRFVLPKIQVTHVWQNATRTEHPGLRPDGCFYSGTVLGDPLSTVSVSLCHGMTGHIRTSTGNYFIEPVEEWVDHATPITHKFYKVAFSPNTFNLQPRKTSNCAVDDVIEVETAENLDEGAGSMNETMLLSRRRGRRSKRSSYISQEYFVEIMVVADKKMAEYHGSELTFYVLTLMAFVADIYKHHSIGNPISITVVKFFVVNDIEFSTHHPNDTRISANEMLRKFCIWQQIVNDNNENSVNHHDSALLLTRENICRNHVKCDTLGLAEVGTMCSKDSSCAIVQDNGLSAAFTIAHELGHVLNMPHDDDLRCSHYQESGTIKNVMSRMLDNNTYPWSWSNCSRHYLTEYLDAGYAECLLDEPIKDFLGRNSTPRLPGENFTEDRQCELVYGIGSKICSYMPVCKQLWCTASVGEQEGCRTLHMPWAEGTPCGEGYWCQKGSCVPQVALKPVIGGWGEWQKFGECSRTCGGGVKKAKRDCNNPLPTNGGRYCLGRRERYRSCNTKDCPPNSQDFREEQCAAFNNINFSIQDLSRDVQWVPKYGGIGADDRCKLYCRVLHSSSYYLLKEKVVDGTVCGPDTFDICVNGVCRPAGCNHHLGSSSQFDYCGQCGGNNSSCQLVSGKYNKTYYGYTKVLRIPAGSSNLDVRQFGYNNSSKDDNYLALIDGETGDYILNGNFIVTTFRKLMLYGGTTLEYSGSVSAVERINCSRPLTKDLIIEILSVGDLYPPDIVYHYTVQHSSLVQYAWELSTDWSTCDKVCNGEQRRLVKCVHAEGRQEVAKELCNGLQQPYSPTLECNNHCELDWEVISQSECSSHCGEGTRILTVQCVQKYYDSRPSLLINNNSCSHLPEPKVLEPCYGPCDVAHWKYANWGPCTKTCGSGVERRMAECVDNMDHPMNDSLCQLYEKIDERVCNTQKCPEWSVGEWTPCSVSCGEGKRTRTVYCSKPGACSNNTKPPSEDFCAAEFCTVSYENAIPDVNSIGHYVWRTHKWGPCSASCGEGLRRRETFCYDKVKGKVIDTHNCIMSDKPPSVDTCKDQTCVTWVTGEWGPCSAICGQGIEKRAVVCMEDGRETDQRLCSGLKPATERVCRASLYCTTSSSTSASYNWKTGPWTECSLPCGGGFMNRQVACLRDDGEIASGNCYRPKPVATIGCNPQPCIGASWQYADWSQCNQTCGGGYQHRQVQCQSKTGIKLPDEACPANLRPSNTQICNVQPCDRHHYRWKALSWSRCSRTCGKGEHYRRVLCVTRDIEMVVDEIYCEHLWKPQTHRICKIGACPLAMEWAVGDWSECSVTCGIGIQQRTIQCRRIGYERVLSDETACDPSTRPNAQRSCGHFACLKSNYSWVPGDWQTCSHPCGKKGRQVRRLFCYNESDKKKVARRHCAEHLKPKRKRKCNQKRCAYTSCRDLQQVGRKVDREYILSVMDRNLSVYCHNMNTSHPKEYITLPTGDRENYAEIYDCRLANPDTCPGRIENCSFFIDPKSSTSGLTIFEKIRINVTTLIVDTKDWTFSRQIKGKRVRFGEAGDCYSRTKCPQGKFSINLVGTGLRVSPYTEWQSLGSHASHQITVDEDRRKVSGKCGGYCGTCSPTTGMKLDVLPP
ncbi:ADAM metallopeptidase with thrombospondin type 1 motif A isoform X2 [Lycorma delicatula]|uniref:ADAM metallopeptidase with thrombospondin type 1 motif A isoform X2 n=1 Tax=Lycorma delicatula TaxID=130591 RepID=UPI003F5182A4